MHPTPASTRFLNLIINLFSLIELSKYFVVVVVVDVVVVIVVVVVFFFLIGSNIFFSCLKLFSMVQEYYFFAFFFTVCIDSAPAHACKRSSLYINVFITVI